jgi:hypothetical protein
MFYFIRRSVWKSFIENHHMKHCKAPLDVIAHKVSTIYIYIYIIQLTPCMLSIHWIFFIVKVGSEARTVEQLLRILCLRVYQGVHKKNS